jgi:hypothetical protein
MKLVVAKHRSFEEEEAATRAFYRSLSPAERLEILFELRERALKEGDAATSGMARVYRIVELQQS